MEKQVREREASLSAWLVLLALGNGLSALLYLFLWVSLIVIKNQADSTVAVGTTLPTLAISSLAALIFIFGVYKWKKWGVFGFATTSLISFYENIQMGNNDLMAFFGLIGIGVLVYLIRPHWPNMDLF